MRDTHISIKVNVSVSLDANQITCLGVLSRAAVSSSAVHYLS